jgi:glyoxylase-like metal-dependent hydrolase (beta-lactamase superfamily II)
MLACAVAPAQTALEAVAKAMGAATLTSIEYAGSGATFTLGQNVSPSAPWPRVEAKSYRRAIDYATPALREDIERPQGRIAQFVSGNSAWNLAGQNPAPAPAVVAERLTQIWLTPHGFVKAAETNKAVVKGRTISFVTSAKQRVTGTVNQDNLVESVSTTIANPVLGDMPVEVAYSEYQAFGEVKFPTRIVQRAGGFPILDVSVNEVRPNAPVTIDVPPAVRDAKPAPVRVEVQKLAEGVWYLTGGSHHSVLVEFKDHLAVVEAPQNAERTLAVLAEAEKTVPKKRVRFVINTHHHFDHSGGLRACVNRKLRIVTHWGNETFYKKAFGGGSYVTVTDKRVLTDGRRSMELYHIQGSPHNEASLMVYLPQEKMLVEADVYSPAPPGAPPPPTPNPASVNLYENLRRLNLDVAQIVPIHGRVVPLGELEKAIGKGR